MRGGNLNYFIISCLQLFRLLIIFILKTNMKDRIPSKKTIRSKSTTEPLKLPKIEKPITKDIKIEPRKRNSEHKIAKEKQQLKKQEIMSVDGKPDSDVTAEAYSIYDEEMNPIIEYRSVEKREIASITKFMTLYASFRLAEKFKTVMKTTYFRVSSNAGNAFGTTAELEPKQWVTIQDLFYALMLPSGNDAALVLAENFGAYLFYEKKGETKALTEIKSLDITEDGMNIKHYGELFIRFMNQLALELGLQNTVYTNPHGLDCKESYSTAKDISILMKKILKIPEIFKVIGMRQYFARLKFSVGKKATSFREADWMNTDRLLWKKGYLGGKTGQTMSAGNCLANVYEQNGKKYLIVVLGCKGKEDRFRDTQRLVEKYLTTL